MKIHLPKSFAAAALATLIATGVHAELITSAEIKSVDNFPPAPVSNLVALDAGASVLLTWDLSLDDAVTFTTFGDAIVPRGGVRGYRIYRQAGEAESTLIASVGPGVDEFSDDGVAEGVVYIYNVKPFDLDNETAPDVVPGSAKDLLRIVELGGAPDIVLVTTVKGSLTIDSNLDLENQDALDLFTENFLLILAEIMGIDASRITITDIRVGSIVVEFTIDDVPAGTEAPSAVDALAALVAAANDAESDDFSSLGGTLLVEDLTSSEVVTVSEPVDASGDSIVGWFTREGTTVDFDDFFLFADHFGETPEDAAWDAQFDIIEDEAIDFDDFFRFADDFGKVVANAADIQAEIGG